VAHTTVLIAATDAIPMLRQQPFLHDSLAIPDTEAGRALEYIREHVPVIIAIERGFAAGPVGQALLKQIQADAGLTSCQIQMVGVRRSQRYKVNVPVRLGGANARLLDISATGAHVVSTSMLKPAQELQLTLRPDGDPLQAVAVWVQYELPKEGPQYRAGIQFHPSAVLAAAEYIAEIAR
jgi:hypothetical protein